MVTLPKLQYKKRATSKNMFLYGKTKQLNVIYESGQENIFTKQRNLLIFGDNLNALGTLLRDTSIKEKVNLIYIDPPFSTNTSFKVGNKRTATISNSEKDLVAYTDKLLGIEYLEFIRQRLILLREILSDNGSIYLHIDNKIGHYVKILMDEVFGIGNFRADITRIKSNPKNFDRKNYGNIKDMILFYTKSNSYIWNNFREDYNSEDLVRLFPKIDNKGRRYTTTPIHAPGETKNGATGRLWMNMKPPEGRHWRYNPKILTELNQEGLLEWSKNGNPRKIIYADETVANGKKIQDVWEFKDPQYPKYPTEKNLEMLKRIVSVSSNPGDMVLDCFCGSGTTLLAAELLGRHWVGIDSSKSAINVAKKKLAELNNLSPFRICNIGTKSDIRTKVNQNEHLDKKKYRTSKLTQVSGQTTGSL